MNSTLLMDYIKSNGISLTAIAKKCKISRNSLYNKLYGESEFKVSEIIAICDILKISNQEKENIFFANSVN